MHIDKVTLCITISEKVTLCITISEKVTLCITISEKVTLCITISEKVQKCPVTQPNLSQSSEQAITAFKMLIIVCIISN
jgi:hypothetical protein